MAQSTGIKLPILVGTKAAYAALENKDSAKFYVMNDATGDDVTLYLGETPLAKAGYGGKTITGVDFDPTDHVFEFTFSDGTTSEIDLPTENVFQSVAYNAETHVVTFTLVSGSTTAIDLSDLIPVAEDTIEYGEENNAAIPTIGAVKGFVVSEIDADSNEDDWKGVSVGALKAALELGTF